MKLHQILKSTINAKRLNNIKPQISKSERCLNRAKIRQEKAFIWDCFCNENQPVYYFEDLNIIGLPRWMN